MTQQDDTDATGRVKNAVSNMLLPALLKTLVATLNMTLHGRISEEAAETGGLIACFWHGSMANGWLLIQRLFPQKKITAVVSLSRDGEILAGTLSKLGFQLIRGSSSRGSQAVKKQMLDTITNHGIVAITPDGPRGPKHRFKYGTLRLASQNRIPLLFADIRCSRSWKLRSWDGFEIPAPFSRVTITLHSITIPIFTNEQELRDFEQKLSEKFAGA